MKHPDKLRAVAAGAAGSPSELPKYKCPKRRCGCLFDADELECPECGYDVPLIILPNRLPMTLGDLCALLSKANDSSSATAEQQKGQTNAD